ncbi:threonine/serine exporter family protein [uncultured Alistipes sp.]|uniref:threonine/serine exporter family protein n=1 Tax=uncultured Alistipes sp. TaxID=538949 RepID=UPI001F894A30|nr:threonine/serine exporter family protein [uncultured Alistipes sp.]HJC27446.1 threonine/serine exporter family protein [Candidatus Alistipes stercoravium]
MMWLEILSDGFFAAVAAIGFGAISDPPMRAFPSIALLAAIGHALRFVLMHWGMDIASASLCASVTIGVGSLLLGGRIRCPMTVLFIPALLPMIPGMYAYKTVFSMIMFMKTLDDPALGAEYLQAIVRNGFITFSVIFMLAAGAAAPIFLFNKRAHSLTRDKKHLRK